MPLAGRPKASASAFSSEDVARAIDPDPVYAGACNYRGQAISAS